MEIFDYVEAHEHEQVVFCHDRSSGLKAIIAIHDTTLGPALGGCRMWPYESEDDALLDVLRLSRGMTYKNSAMGLDFGGGKSVILADPDTDKSEALFRAFGKFVDSLGGRYITAEDVSTNTDDVSHIHRETDHVVGLPGRSGDPSPVTAYGVFTGIQACSQYLWGSRSLEGRTVTVQGVGHVGYYLARHLHEAGCGLVVTDIDEERVQRVVHEFDADAVAPDDIYDVDCDIFAPCALGAVINDDTIDRLACRVVAGSANNQLAEPRHGDALRERDILYAPDYVINGGGVINVAEEYAERGYDQERAYNKVSKIYDKILQVFEIAERDGIPPYQAADTMAEERIRRLAPLRRIYLGD